MAEYKVVNTTQLDADLASVADAIRTKGGTTESLIFPQGFVDAIESGGISKEEQEKTIDITENGTTVVTPDEGMALSEVTVNVEVESGNTEEIENLIDESGVLGTTDETVTVTDKVEQLIDKAEDLKALNEVTSKRLSFSSDYEGVQEPFVLPKHDFSSAINLSTFCNNSYVTDIPYYINSPNCTNISSAFSRTPNFKHMVGIDTSKVTNAYNCFYQSGIEEIDEPFDFSSVTNTNYSPNFNQCNNLKKISFKENTLKYSMTFTSAVLSDEDEVDENGEIIRESSIKSILKGLAPVETTQTLRVDIFVYDKMLNDKFFDLVSEAIDKGWEITA